MTYPDELLSKIVGFGTLGYPLSKILNLLDISDADSFCRDFDDKNHVLYKHYQKGIDKAEYAIDMMLFDKSRAGDLVALKLYEERKKINVQKEEKERKKRFYETE
jgi:hypothetical protein